MNIEKLTNNWDEDNKKRIDSNFAKLASLDYKIMTDFIDSDPAALDTSINGKMRTSEAVLRDLSDYGTNFTAQVNGFIHRGWVYTSGSGRIGFGLAEQTATGVATSETYFTEVDLVSGWNHVTLNFPVEQNKSYTLFKRTIGNSIATYYVAITGWNSHPFISNGLKFNAGKFLSESSTYISYGPFFEFEVVTNLAQIYKLVNESVVPAQQFYVGDNPPLDAQFWFKPVGGS